MSDTHPTRTASSAAPAGPSAKMYTQQAVDRIVARRLDHAARDAQRALIVELGFDPATVTLGDLKALLAKARDEETAR